MASIRDELGVLEQRTRSDLERRRLPLGPSSLNLLIADVHLQGVLDGVDVDHVAIANEGDRSTDLCLWGDVSDDEAVGAMSERGGLTDAAMESASQFKSP